MSPGWSRFLAILFIIALFFILSAILMGTWNYVIPALVKSINGSSALYTNISYEVSMVFMIMIVVILGPGQLARGIWKGMVMVTDGAGKLTKSKNATAYNTSPLAASPSFATTNAAWGTRVTK